MFGVKKSLITKASKYVGWRCPKCNQWQMQEFRLKHAFEFKDKLKKVCLTCVYCRKSRKLKKENSFGLECDARLFDDKKACQQFVQSSNAEKNTNELVT